MNTYRITAIERVAAYYDVEADSSEEAIELLSIHGEFVCYGEFLGIEKVTAELI